MTKQAREVLNKRAQFLTLLDQDISKNEIILAEITKEIEELKATRDNIKELGKKPQHESLIPLCKNLYMPGTIVHTGEYLVTRKAYPHSYSVLKTLDQTLTDLDERIQEQRELLIKAELAVSQLLERKRALVGETDEEDVLGMESLPKEIKSDRGVAIKMGDFYEILEYEED